MKFLKENWFKAGFILALILAICLLFYRTFKVASIEEQMQDCLKLGSDSRSNTCLDLINIPESEIQNFEPVFQKIQEWNRNNADYAKTLLDSLSPKDYLIYKRIKANRVLRTY